MADTDGLENVLEHLSESINPGERRVINRKRLRHEVEQRVLWQGKIKGYAVSVRGYCQLKHFLTKMVAMRGTRNVLDLNIVYPKMAKFCLRMG